jgi:hypothetical protein
VPVALDRLRPGEGDCPSLQRLRHWFIVPTESGMPSWQFRLDHLCADTPGSRPECKRCPAMTGRDEHAP